MKYARRKGYLLDGRLSNLSKRHFAQVYIYRDIYLSLYLSRSLTLFRRRRFLLRLLCVVARSTVIRNALIYRRSCEQTQTGQNRPSILIYLERAQSIHCKVSIRIYIYIIAPLPVCPSHSCGTACVWYIRRRWRYARFPAEESIYIN